MDISFGDFKIKSCFVLFAIYLYEIRNGLIESLCGESLCGVYSDKKILYKPLNTEVRTVKSSRETTDIVYFVLVTIC